MSHIRWSDAEIEFLVGHYPDRGLRWCAEKLARTSHSVKWQAYVRGLKYKHRQPWRKQDDELIRSVFPCGDLAALARRLNKSTVSVKVRAHHLGVARQPHPSAKMVKAIQLITAGMCVAEAAKQVGISRQAIYKSKLYALK